MAENRLKYQKYLYAFVLHNTPHNTLHMQITINNLES